MDFPPPPTAPPFIIPTRRYIPESRPAFLQAAQIPDSGSLFIRKSNISSIISTCPDSISLLILLNSRKISSNGNFDFQTNFINDDEVPRFEIQKDVYYSVDDLNNSTSSLLLEPKVTALGLISEKIQSKIPQMLDAIRVINNAYLFGYKRICHPQTQWVTNAVGGIKMWLGLDDDEAIEEALIQKTEDACKILSKEIQSSKTFLEYLMEELNITEKTQISSLSILDVKQAAPAILIMKCFAPGNVSSAYATKIRRILYRCIPLRAHTDFMAAWFIAEPIRSLDYTLTLERNPSLLATTLAGVRPEDSGSHGDVYKVSILEDGNEWRLSKNDYAFKVSRNLSLGHLTNEAGVLIHMPFANTIRIVGEGFGEFNDKRVFFLVTKWVSGGNLHDKMKGYIPCAQIIKILNGIAYALHLLYASICGCVVDLKPANILLDEDDNPVLCDFGSFRFSGEKVAGAFSGTPLYHDNTYAATHARDIFAFGVITFQLLTDEVNTFQSERGKQAYGRNFGLRIDAYIDEEKDLGELVKECLRDELDNAKQLLRIAAKCVSMKSQRPSAFEILQKFQELFEEN
ncbi:hypothetical protein P3S68_032641 [Capsicum galapagoense]